MKKVFFALSLILISFSSCKKDDAVSTVYTQTMLNGTWENVVKEDGIAEQLIITPTSLKNGNSIMMFEASTYKFDGKKISYTMNMEIIVIKDELTINELTSTKLVVTSLASKEKSEYKKIK